MYKQIEGPAYDSLKLGRERQSLGDHETLLKRTSLIFRGIQKTVRDRVLSWRLKPFG